MYERNEVSREYALLCGEISDTVDYLENLVARLKAAMNEAEEICINGSKFETNPINRKCKLASSRSRKHNKAIRCRSVSR